MKESYTRLGKIRDLMLDGVWRTPEEVRDQTGGCVEKLMAVSARLRDLRKEDYGSWEMETRWRGGRGDGVLEYRMTGRKVEPAQKRHDHNHEKCLECAEKYGEAYRAGKAAGQALAS